MPEPASATSSRRWSPADPRRWSRPGCCTRPGRRLSISVYIVVAAVITVVCCLALADRSRVNIEDGAVYSRA